VNILPDIEAQSTQKTSVLVSRKLIERSASSLENEKRTSKDAFAFLAIFGPFLQCAYLVLISAFSESSVFDVNTKAIDLHFQKSPLWRTFSKTSVFGAMENLHVCCVRSSVITCLFEQDG